MWGSRCWRCHRGSGNEGDEVGVGLGVNIKVPLDIGAQLSHLANLIGLRGIGCHVTGECGDITMCWESQS